MTKNLDYYMNLPYKEIVKKDNGGYIGYIPDLKGCVSQAKNKNEVEILLKAAKKYWIERALEIDMDIPEPVNHK
jgi:antitoxin HicB